MSRNALTLVVVCLIAILGSASAESFRKRSHARRLFFGNPKTSPTTTTEEPSFGQSFSNWLSGLISGDSQKDKPDDSFSKLALLKKFLSSSSSSSDDKGSKLDKLFQLLTHSAQDDKNQGSSSSSKINSLLGFFSSQGSSSSSSSSNLQLAMKLINLAQGNGGLSSLSGSDIKSLLKFVSG